MADKCPVCKTSLTGLCIVEDHFSQKPVETRDLDADLALCEAATWETWDKLIWHIPAADFHFTAESRQGWPYAIRRAQEAEREVDRLRNEIGMLQEQLSQHHRSGCYD